jgi:hypothetical protein
MNEHEIHSLLATANPMSTRRAAALPIGNVQAELLAELLAEPAPAIRVRRTRGARGLPRLGVALAAVAAAVIAIAVSAGGGHGGSGTAWAAEQVRFAENSPLVLLGASGWTVDYADEQSAQEGEMRFEHPGGEQAALNWRSGSMAMWIDDRANGAAVATTAPVLGTTAHVYEYAGGTPGHQDVTGLFEYDGRVLEFRAGVADVAAYKALLATLERVDTDRWLSAMPPSAIKVADHDTVVAQMLKGVTVPPGFDPSTIKGADLTTDRYQLGAAVAGTVACQWIRRWSDARRTGDKAAEQQAIDAMATAKDWPVLKDMAKHGAYPQVLTDYAKAMPSGTWYGRPLVGDADQGLGCSDLGVPLR